MNDLLLRDVVAEDLTTFFEQQKDPEGSYMAAFTAKDPTDREAFNRHWERIMTDPTVIIKTIVCDGRVAGHVLSYEEDGKVEVSYWLGKVFWGRGIATRALATFLEHVNRTRPINARVAKDNLASIRVLEKCGFRITGEAKGFANARDEEIRELILELAAERNTTPSNLRAQPR